MLYSVIVCRNVDCVYTYESEQLISVGQIIEVPLRRSNVLGIVFAILESNAVDEHYTVKKINKITNYILKEETVKFIKWLSFYTVNSLGNIARQFVNSDVLDDKKSLIKIDIKQELDIDKIYLTDTQEKVYEQLELDCFHVSVLRGVTGSGKTLIYLKAAIKKLNEGKQILILVPEIALNEQLINNLFETFNVKPYVWNSSIPKAQKREIWKSVYLGELKLIIGTRSAIFLPFCDLGLIIVDEEHDHSYKQETRPIYNAKNASIVLGKILNIPVILSSATVSLDIMKNIKSPKYSFIDISERFSGSDMPNMSIIVHDDNKNIFFNQSILDKISQTLDNGEQTLIYLNRLGYSPITLCKSCGRKYVCPDCDISLVHHHNKCGYLCHYCGFFIKESDRCIYCSAENSLKDMGLGIEKVFEYMKERFSDKNIALASSETLDTKSKIRKFIDLMNNKEIDIVVGTQIMSKGHNFKNLTFCVIMDIDFSINSPDIRALEKTYQMIHQTSGRTGRGGGKGEVVIQTALRKDIIEKAAILSDFHTFAKYELDNRRIHNLPPYSHLVAIIITGNTEENVIRGARKLCANKLPENIEVLGPIPAPISRIKNKTRWRILLRSKDGLAIQRNIKSWIKSANLDSRVQVNIDVDPISFL